MKKERKLLTGFVLCMLVGLSMGGVSCRKDEPAPEIVVNPLEQKVYYIVGKVTQGSVGLEGVAVNTTGGKTKTTADGFFQLEVVERGGACRFVYQRGIYFYFSRNRNSFGG